MNRVHGGLCVATVVFGRYTEYIPYYIDSILTSYPDYYVKIFVPDEALPAAVEASLQHLRETAASNFAVTVGCFSELPHASTVICAREPLGMYLRWLLPPAAFAGFEYGYTGDVDFLIMAEAEPLLDSHVRHCRALEVPYSNAIRRGTRRLTGLHFIETNSYFARVGQLIRFYTDRERLLQLNLTNEELLYLLIEQTVGFGRMDELPLFRPTHGVHLGWVRSGNWARVDRWLEAPENRTWLTGHLRRDSFKAIHTLVGNREVEALRRRVTE